MIPAQEETSAEQLLGELLACPLEERAALLEKERFRSSELLDLLLEECQAALPFEPARGEELLAAVSTLGRYFEQEGATELGFELERKGRAVCLRGTARRLVGDHRGAEAAFDHAAFMEVGRGAQAFFCRSLGLLRWDQGRYEEATALVRHAARRYEESECVEEMAVCLALEGILGVDQMAFLEAAPVLEAALEELDGERRPWLVCQASLSLALCRLKQNQILQARALWAGAGLYRASVPAEARVGLDWLAGTVAAGLGDGAGAEALLRPARQAFLAARQLPEATLATIDLGELLVKAGRQPELEPLVEEVEAAFEGGPGLEVTLGGLEWLVVDAKAGVLEVPAWLGMRSALRLLWHHQGVFFQPVPFA